MHLRTCVLNKNSNLPLRNLIRAMKNLCILGYPDRAQRRFRSACANAQADLNLRWVHIFDGTISDVAVHIDEPRQLLYPVCPFSFSICITYLKDIGNVVYILGKIDGKLIATVTGDTVCLLVTCGIIIHEWLRLLTQFIAIFVI